METTFLIKGLGSRELPTLHSYFDVCPESPDGARILATEFTGSTIPGPARIVVLDRDGVRIESIGEAAPAIGHVGRFALWLDNWRVAYRSGTDESSAAYVMRELASGEEETRPGSLRQWHTATQRGLVQWSGNQTNPNRFAQGIRVVDSTGTTISELDVADVHAALPPDAGAPEPESIDIRNLKWSPSGEAFFAVVTDEAYRVRVLGDVDARWRFKCLVLFDADGSNPRYIGNFTHHPAWAPDGTGITFMETRDNGEGQDLIVLRNTGARAVLLEKVEGIHGSLDSTGTRFVIDEREPDRRYGHIALHLVADGSRVDLVRFAHTRWDHTDGHHPHPVFSRREDRIYFNAADSGVCRLYAIEGVPPLQ